MLRQTLETVGYGLLRCIAMLRVGTSFSRKVRAISARQLLQLSIRVYLHFISFLFDFFF